MELLNFDTLEERAKAFGRYIVENNATVRQAAKEFNLSKSTIHKEINGRLKDLDPCFYQQVKDVSEKNKSERHFRGGMEIKRKYEQGILKRRKS